MRREPGSVEWVQQTEWEPRGYGVDLWCGDLQFSPDAERCLCVEERVRADRFVSRGRGESFIASRSMMRRILSQYVGCTSSEVKFDYGTHGKPRLTAEGPPLHFNLSHSGEKFILAVSNESEVGVDIEQIRADRRLVEIGKRFFAPEEHARMCEQGASGLVDYFYRLWACKEAYLKVHGTGFSFPAADFCVRLEPPGPQVEWTRLDGDIASRWRMDRVGLPFEGYSAALCSHREGPLRAFVCPPVM